MSRMRLRRRSRIDSYAAHSVKYGAARLGPYTPPWLAWLSLPVVVGICRAMAGGTVGAAMATSAGLAVAVIGLTAFTWHVFRARGQSVRVHATAFAASCGGWVLWATITGLFRTPTVSGWHVFTWLGQAFNWSVWCVWLLCGLTGCLTWTIRRVARGEGNDTHEDGSGGLMEKVGIAGRVGVPKLEAGDTRVRVPVQVEPGEQTAEDVQGAKGRLASVLRVRRTGVRVIADPDDHSRAEVVVVPRDQLAKRIDWPGPNAPGGSIAEEIHVGRYEDAETARLWLPGDPRVPRNATHLGVMGMSGAGKSEGGLILCVNAITRTDASVLYSDPVKGIQTCAPIAAGIDFLAADRKTAVAMFRRLPTVIAHRTQHLGKHGFKQWIPAAALPPCGLDFLIYVWEEAADLLANSELFVKVSEQARSAGIALIPSQQRFSHDRMQTSARFNLGGGWCFGVGDEVSARFALSEETIDAGAAPWTWKADKPGYSYLEAPGVPQDRWPIPLRSFYAEPDHLREVVAEYAHPGLDEVTAAAFGEVYADYRRQVVEGAAPWQTDTGRAVIPVEVAVPQGDADDDEYADGDDVDGDESDDDVDPLPPVPPNPEPGFMENVDPSQEIPDDDDEPIGLVALAPAETARLSPSQARAALRAELEARAAAGHESVHTSELVEIRQRVGRSPAWLSQEMRRLVEEGYLTDEPDRGAYGLPSPVPA